MTQKQARQHESEEFPLAHDAATWDEVASESGWDDEEAQLAGEMARFADD